MQLKQTVLAVIIVVGMGQTSLAETVSPPLAGQPQLRQLLQQEMQALRQAVGTLAQSLAQGDWQTLAETAGQVHDSFIFQKKLTDADRKLLHQNLPQGFIRRDKSFHRQARNLQLAAQTQDMELSLFYYSKMIESCVTCHSQYATHRFPSLANSASGNQKH